MKVAALIVTKDRPAWASWWAWNLAKQTRKPDKIIVVDSSKVPTLHESLDGVELNVVLLDNDKITGEARQAALDHFFVQLASEGEDPSDWILMWFDDDDWYHPERIRIMAEAIEGGYPLVAFPPTWTLYLDTMMLYENPEYFEYISLPNAAFAVKYCVGAKVNPTIIGEDTHWRCWVMDNIEKQMPEGPMRVAKFLRPAEVSCFMIKHGGNVWRRGGHTDFALDFDDSIKPFPKVPDKGVTREEWAETWRQLEQVRRGLGMSK